VDEFRQRVDSPLGNAHPVPVATSPHHQHVGSEENVQPSEPMTLEKVLTIIAARIIEG
jgi:hypothetical protein